MRAIITSDEHTDLAAGLRLVDEVAEAALRPTSMARYAAYRSALIADGLELERLVPTLWLFVWNLADECSVNGVH